MVVREPGERPLIAGLAQDKFLGTAVVGGFDPQVVSIGAVPVAIEENPRATVERSRWLAVLEQQADGSWLLIRDFGEPVE